MENNNNNYSCLKCERYVSPTLHWNYRGFSGFPVDLDCDHITDIYLKENSISEFPAGLVNFRRLKNLYLTGNNINRVPGNLVQQLRDLTCLDLSGNLLENIPGEISKLTNLKCLILDDNRITQIPITVRKLKKLKYFSICDNNISFIIQRPVPNFYGSEFRCWRNKMLCHVPFSIWMHLLQGHHTNIIGYPKHSSKFQDGFGTGIRIPDCDNLIIYISERFSSIQNFNDQQIQPPSLLELCMRKCAAILKDATAAILKNATAAMLPESEDCIERELTKLLPCSIVQELMLGGTEFCDVCQTPLYTSCILDVTVRPIFSVNETSEILISVVFCSRKCCIQWRTKNREKIFNWTKIS